MRIGDEIDRSRRRYASGAKQLSRIPNARENSLYKRSRLRVWKLRSTPKKDPDKTHLWFLKNEPRKEKRREKGCWSQGSDSSSKTLMSASIKSHRALECPAGS